VGIVRWSRTHQYSLPPPWFFFFCNAQFLPDGVCWTLIFHFYQAGQSKGWLVRKVFFPSFFGFGFFFFFLSFFFRVRWRSASGLLLLALSTITFSDGRSVLASLSFFTSFLRIVPPSLDFRGRGSNFSYSVQGLVSLFFPSLLPIS